jgi:hypothetical protein
MTMDDTDVRMDEPSPFHVTAYDKTGAMLTDASSGQAIGSGSNAFPNTNTASFPWAATTRGDTTTDDLSIVPANFTRVEARDRT